MTVYAPDLRDSRHLDAVAARECADWVAAMENRGLAPRTWTHYAYTVWDLLEAHMEKEASEFTAADLDHLLASYPAAGRDTRRAHLASWFRYLKLRRLIPENPMDFLEPTLRRRKPKLPDVFSEAERSAFEAALDVRDSALVTIMFETGLRNGECRSLQRRHINLRRAELAVFDGKGGKDRLVPLTQKAQQAVAQLDLLEGLDPEDHLWYAKPGGSPDFIQRRFLNPEGIGQATFGRWWRRMVDQAGVRYRKPHMTRHTFATEWRRRGLDLDELQILLGHESIQTTSDLYVHTTVADVAVRMAELEAGV